MKHLREKEYQFYSFFQEIEEEKLLIFSYYSDTQIRQGHHKKKCFKTMS